MPVPDTRPLEEPRPHPFSNDLAPQRDLTSGPGSRDVRRDALPPAERRIAGPILVVGLFLAVVGVGIAAWLFKTPGLVIGSIIFIVLIGLLFLWPVLAASSLKAVQDEKARESA